VFEKIGRGSNPWDGSILLASDDVCVGRTKETATPATVKGTGSGGDVVSIMISGNMILIAEELNSDISQFRSTAVG
jgi:hypothetical protein